MDREGTRGTGCLEHDGDMLILSSPNRRDQIELFYPQERIIGPRSSSTALPPVYNRQFYIKSSNFYP